MNVSQVFLALQGWNAAGLARTVACNQLAFDYNRSLNQSRKKDDRPVFDAHAEDEYAEYAKMDKTPEAKPLDQDELLQAHAAAWILARRHIWKPNPETGRPLEHMKRYVVSLPNTVVSNVERLTQRNIDAAKADALQLADPTTGEVPDISARLDAIKAENRRLAQELIDKVAEPYKACLTKFSEYDDADLVPIVLEALGEAGRSAAMEITRAADAQQAAARKRMMAGQFARIEPDIYALTSIGQRGGKAFAAAGDLMNATLGAMEGTLK